MNRTQEEYNRDGSVKPPNPLEGLLPFPDWSDWRLEERLADVTESFQIPHGEARRQQISRELSHLTFELGWRNPNAVAR